MPARIASSFKTTFNWSQNPKVNSTFKYVVPAEYASVNQVFSGQVDFDPAPIFLNGSDWLSAYRAADLYGDAEEINFTRTLLRRCGASGDSTALADERSKFGTAACVRKLSGPQGWVAFAAALTPKVTFVEKSNFDFLVSNGVLAPNPYTTKRLADLTFSVDLLRVLPSAKARQDALATLLAAKNKKPKPSVDPTWQEIDSLVGRWAAEPEQLDVDSEGSIYRKLVAALMVLRRS